MLIYMCVCVDIYIYISFVKLPSQVKFLPVPQILTEDLPTPIEVFAKGYRILYYTYLQGSDKGYFTLSRICVFFFLCI